MAERGRLAKERAKIMKAYYCFVGEAEYSILVFSMTKGLAKAAVAQEIDADFTDVTCRRCSGYDRYARNRISPHNTPLLLMDNADCAAAGVPDYYSEVEDASL